LIEVKQAPPSPTGDYLSNVYSQNGEDGLLEEVFRRIGTTNKQCFECGAADGKWFSNTRKLIDEGWSALLIEEDPKNWPELDKLDNPPKVEVVHGRLEPRGNHSLDYLLGRLPFAANPDLGVLDVDGQEYHLWNCLMKYRPRVMVVEYDNTGNPDFVPELGGEGQAGLNAILSVATSKGYANVFTTKTNAIFVIDSEREKFYAADKRSLTSEEKPTPAAPVPVVTTPTSQEYKVSALLSRPRFGLNVFWDCASQALSPWGIPLQSFYGVFWGQCMQKGMEDAINEGVDWMLCLDYDTMFTSKHVQQLIDAMGNNPEVDAVAALQVRRGRPLPLLVRQDGAIPLTGGLVPADTAHFGLTLIRVSSLMKMAKPWFWSTPTPAGDWGEGRLDDDIFFWGHFRDSGNKLFVHTGCKIGHVEEMVAHYDADGKVQHTYISEWRKKNGHQIESFE
jgi:hypothetical protein